MSKARLIRHYVAVVEVDSLPAPFNAMQWIICSPMLLVDVCFETALYKDAKRFFGRFVFWAMLGPIAVAAGWLLWAASMLKAATIVWQTSSENTLGAKIGKVIFAVACCTVGAPVWLTVLWIKGGLTGMRSVMKHLRNRTGGVCCRGKKRVKTRGKLRTIFGHNHASSNHVGNPTRVLGDAPDDVVEAILKEDDRGQ